MRRRPGLVIHPIVFLEAKTLIGSTEGHGLVIHPIVFLEAKTFFGRTEGHGLVIHQIVFLIYIIFLCKNRKITKIPLKKCIICHILSIRYKRFAILMYFIS